MAPKGLAMFKTWLVTTLTSLTSLLLTVTTAAAATTNASETVQMKAALCMQWECPSLFMKDTGLENTLEQLGRKAAQETIAEAQEDAEYFAEKVIFTEPGNEPQHLYKNVQIRILPGDRLTITVGSKEVLLNTQGQRLFNVDNFQAHVLKINGRRLITRELYAAHQATQNLIIAGAITPPLNELASATNARLLNKRLLQK